MRIKYSLLLLLVLVGVGKGLGSVKETVSAIQTEQEVRERVGDDSAPVQGTNRLERWYLSLGIQYVGIKTDCRSPYYSAPGRLWYPSRSYYNLGL